MSPLNDLPYLQSFAQAFGEVMIEFAALEGILFNLTIDLATDDFFHGAILLAGVPYAGLVDRFCALALHITRDGEEFEAKIDDSRRALLDVNERRNRLVHSDWLFEPIAGSASRVKVSAKGRNGLRFDIPEVPRSELKDLVQDIREVQRRCRDLGRDVREVYRKQGKLDDAAE
jgi:hypothetical protein